MCLFGGLIFYDAYAKLKYKRSRLKTKITKTKVLNLPTKLTPEMALKAVEGDRLKAFLGSFASATYL